MFHEWSLTYDGSPPAGIEARGRCSGRRFRAGSPVAYGTPSLPLIYAGLIGLNALYYGWRQGVLRRRGVSIIAVLRAESDARLAPAASRPG